MRRDSVVQAVAVAGMLAFLSGSVLLTTRVSASAGRAKLSYTDTLEEGTPPMVAVGVAMGAFRGLFVNYLWIRANNLKEEGKYHEAVDLATTITKLQPRFPRVWAFHAWNLSYNISVATQTPQERWQWVQSGIALLRDQGIPANPGDVLLHKELAWIFLHKVQGVMDDANAFYKQELARQWTIVLGPPPRRDDTIRTREQLIEAYAARLDRLVATPDTLEELFRRVPGTAELVERLRTRAGWDLTGRLWTELGTA
ncbi:MAG TPA: hypothetical protein VD963_02620, partial [Phycisphaerales bacterium]|nr:hypothetical protein [Phycisphaerales bacterium]